MRFLVDAALSPTIAQALRGAEHDAIHVYDLGMLHAGDVEILDRALADERTIISADTDFAMLLATQGRTKPSFILFRHPVHAPESQVRLLLLALPEIAEDLGSGSIVVIEATRVRIRQRPVSDYEPI